MIITIRIDVISLLIFILLPSLVVKTALRRLRAFGKDIELLNHN
jgi:hypothetical protein